MTGKDRLLEWFGEGRLVRPRADVPNFVDLTRALFKLTGVPETDWSPRLGDSAGVRSIRPGACVGAYGIRPGASVGAGLAPPACGTEGGLPAGGLHAELAGADVHVRHVRPASSSDAVDSFARLIGPAEHYVFVLVDGLGTALLSKAPENGFLRRHVVAELQAVFPSTTAVALTTLATGQWPASHGVPGWWVYLDEFKLSATGLPFTERFTERPLSDWGVKAADVFPVPSVWPRMRHAPVTVIGANIAQSVYTNYSVGGTRCVGHSGMGDAFAKVAGIISDAAEPTFVYVYLPQIDSLCHEKGTFDAEVTKLIAVVDGYLGELARSVGGKARLIVTADHGLADTPEERRFVICDDDPLLAHLVCPPTCEPTVPVFHVREGREEDFAREFDARLGGCFGLFTPQDAEDLRLFGPEPLSPVIRKRLGTFLALACEPCGLHYRTRAMTRKIHIGLHAGLSEEEMGTQLVLA